MFWNVEGSKKIPARGMLKKGIFYGNLRISQLVRIRIIFFSKENSCKKGRDFTKTCVSHDFRENKSA